MNQLRYPLALAILAATLGALIGYANAGAAKEAQKTVEILGVTLGQPMSLKECAPGVRRGSKGRCWAHDTEEKEHLWVFFSPDDKRNFPFLEYDFYSVYLSENTVARIFISTNGIDGQFEALNALTRKFGPPATSKTEIMQNRMGAEFEVVRATWVDIHVIVDFQGAADRIDSGGIHILTPAAADELLREATKDKPSL